MRCGEVRSGTVEDKAGVFGIRREVVISKRIWQMRAPQSLKSLEMTALRRDSIPHQGVLVVADGRD